MLQEIKPEVQINTDGITLSAAAAVAVQSIFNERKLEGFGLRVFVAGSGCCGAQFGMALDNNFRENDFTFVSEGVKVVVDDMSMEYLRGAKVDFINDPVRGAGFIVDSPVSLSGGSCSCGSKSEEGSSCGCGGGSCGCGN
jgi:iron-sulfur cluster assembly protein